MSVKVMKEFSGRAWEGFSLQTDDPAKALAALDDNFDVLSVYPVVWIAAPNNDITGLNPTNLKGAYSAWTSSSPTSNTPARLAAAGKDRLDGSKVKVGIIDTGVDYTHPALKDKVQYQYDFVGDAFRSGGVPAPKSDAMDCAGHGTHVAGIIAGSLTSTSFNYSGVAPGVVLGAYKVFGCAGSTTSEIVVAAMERAASDGMQIINLSMGDEGAWQGPVADAAARLTAAGTMVVAAAGNAGTSGLFMSTSAANAPSAFAVASVQSYAGPATLKFRMFIPQQQQSGAAGSTTAAGLDAQSFGIQAAFGNASALVGAALKPSAAALASGTAAGNTAADGCGTDPAGQSSLGDLSGTVALLALGGCSPAVKIANAIGQKAIGVMLYGDDDSIDDLRRIPLASTPGSWPSPTSPFRVPVLAVNTATGIYLYGTYVKALSLSPGLPANRARPPSPSPSPPPYPPPPSPGPPSRPPSPTPSPPPLPPSSPPSSPPPRPAVSASAMPAKAAAPGQAFAQGQQRSPSPPPTGSSSSSPSPSPSSSPSTAPSSSPSPSSSSGRSSGSTSSSSVYARQGVGLGGQPSGDPATQVAPPQTPGAPLQPQAPPPTPPPLRPRGPPPPPVPPAQPPLTPPPKVPVATTVTAAASVTHPDVVPYASQAISVMSAKALATTGASATVGRRLLSSRRLLLEAEGNSGGSSKDHHSGRSRRGPLDGLRGGAGYRRQLLQGSSAPQLPTILEVTGTLASSFSSWGPSPELRIKPTVAAPGGAILSTVPTRLSASGFAYLSGTSQAAPYVTGALALALAAGKSRNITTAQLEAALVTTSVPLRDVSDTSTTAQPALPAASALRVGAGVIDIAAMVTNLLDVNVTRMELGSSLAGGGRASFNIEATNNGAVPLSFQLLHVGAATVNASTLLVVDPTVGPNNTRGILPYDAPLVAAAAANVNFSSSRASTLTTLTVPAGGVARFKVSFSLAGWVGPDDQLLFSGYVLLSPVPPAPSTDGSFSDPAALKAAQLQPPLYLPYMGYSQYLTSMPLLLPSLPGGISDPNGAWVWDVNGSGLLATDIASPPPASYYVDYLDEPSAPPPPPPSALTYQLSGNRASLPSIALFVQRQPADQEIQLFRASDDAKLGTISLAQSIRRMPDGQPYIIKWGGTYFDLMNRREVAVAKGDFYFVVRLTRVSALNEDPASAPCEAWKSQIFSLR